MRMTTYRELFLKAQDLVAEALEANPSLREMLKPDPTLSIADDDNQYETGRAIIERIAKEVVPDDISDAKILNFLREDPSIISFEGAGHEYTVRGVVLDIVRYRMVLDQFDAWGLTHPDRNIEYPGRTPTP